MVLESLIISKKIKRKPIEIVPYTFIISLLSLGVSYHIFYDNAGIAAPFLITLCTTYIYHGILRAEGRVIGERLVWRHKKAFEILFLFWLGVSLANLVLGLALPSDYIGIIFNCQIKEINSLAKIETTPWVLFTNKLSLLSLVFVLSFLLDSVVLIFLAWYSSIFTLYIVSLIRESVATYFSLPPLAALMIFLETLAFLIVGFAGGILSMKVMEEKGDIRKIKDVLEEVLLMFSIGVIFLLGIVTIRFLI